MPTKNLPLPTSAAVEDAIARFDQDARYGPADRVLAPVFAGHPKNTRYEDVLLKVALLNALYNTNIFAFWQMATHILHMGLDDALERGEVAIVERIAVLTIGGKARRHYSFATKYCSWHRPDEYPIYDSLVERALWGYRKVHAFAEFRRQEMQGFVGFKGIVSAFRRHFGLDDFTFKELDKFLWFTGRELGR